MTIFDGQIKEKYGSFHPYFRIHFSSCALFILRDLLSIDQSFYIVTMSQAFVQKPAPQFQGTAVDKSGNFVELKLSNYKGNIY